MEPGSDQRYVRCRRCHDVFQNGLANCPRCGAAYVPAADPSVAATSSYADKYSGTEFSEPLDLTPSVPTAHRSGLGFLLAIGVALVVMALAVGGLVALGAFDAPAAATPRHDIVVTITPTPTPMPTLPPIVSQTLIQLADPNLNTHLVIQTTVSVNARVTGRSQASTVNMAVDCAGGNESGTETAGGVTYEWRLVDGTYYTRRLPTGTWKAQGTVSPFVILSPLFSLTNPRMLQYDGPDQVNGIEAIKLESTQWWTPDSGKLSGLDVATLPINPEHTQLMLWVAADGSPIYATFRAWTDAHDGTGTNLLNISTTYTFSNEGAVLPIPSPTMK